LDFSERKRVTAAGQAVAPTAIPIVRASRSQPLVTDRLAAVLTPT
jgi:hypothetical protein